MRKFLISVSIALNNKKISAIRELRDATGMGLLESKNFCERRFPDNFDASFGGSLIVNGDQAARLFMLVISPYILEGPRFFVESIEEIKKPDTLDISNLLV